MEAAPDQDQHQPQHKPSEHTEHDFDVKTLLSWSAPGRPFTKKGRQFYLSVILLLGLFEVILFLFSQYELMLVLVALTFLSLVLSSVPPHNFHYKITTEGIKVEDYFYIWSELYDFYFKFIDRTDVLIVRTQAFLPGELKISLGDIPREHVRKILVRYLPYREYVHPTFMEKSAEWLSHNFPLEKT
ncbi:MAG: hypothetical protein A3C30_03435 [Candidatus Levybacteria bacterium RIFCSPHIGHO2_02_FULL_40_18]|nr:MAG: hypothetical protein A2869_01805 [Candidatus Levybacteria bacterium RIFCSPHIGHO2_01_FULL_40_58]OGH26138.1 MAG: hypothetical protein A3C30_03435 [Candidatus Levybacteria bacterium RIFCSPHIGHO2_02_FULL_40_18]OGH31314.1 MAG: hypothetical protein A3E43_03070 [Candidatus Levybacteria bacterium RIFCSPHIGHO2_12_FULL_40_31]OGH39967.1 MAG: hypothetical protein A2894_02785 [Candidatus Levybacteria bacterium RIFCSPLOWO2_01_FULL_40_64]OGH49613.1 MAG: hypothetical protein A3I54_05220 [Candidatus Lev